MRFMMIISLPHQEFNAAVKDGSASAKVGRILEAQKPEAAYFTEIDGKRTAVLVVDMADVSNIPSLAEPWFLTFSADVQFRAVMSADDLKRSGLEELGKRWG